MTQERDPGSGGAGGEPAQLALGDIETDEGTFQWRLGGFNVEERTRHVQELTRALKDRQKPLDPILVLRRGDKYVVVDGHHRYEAYKEADWDRLVPVEVFQGTPEEAEIEALRRNIKDKLPMTQEDKLEAAWRLVLAQKYSKAQITEMTTVSNGTVGNMRKALEQHGAEVVAEMSWAKVKLLNFNLDDDFDYEEHKHRKAEKLAKEIVKKSSIHLANNPDILALALEMIAGDLPRALVREWYHLAEELVEEQALYPDI